jgi:hypothetical protein
MSEVLPSQKSDLLLVLIRAALVGMLVQPETVPTEGSDEFVCPTGICSLCSRSSCTTTTTIALIVPFNWRRRCQARRCRVVSSCDERSWADFTMPMPGRHE